MFARAQVQKGRSARQTKSGASGSELLLAGKHVPDRVGESACEVDLGDLGAALLSEPALGPLIALGVGGGALARASSPRVAPSAGMSGRTWSMGRGDPSF